MGKGAGFLLIVKKAFSCQTTENRDKRLHKSKKWPGSQRSMDLDSSTTENPIPIDVPSVHSPIATEQEAKLIEAENDQNRQAYSVALVTEQEAKLIEAENEQNRQAYSVALATAVAAEAAVAAAQAAAEVVRLTSAATLVITKEEMAAIKIQTAFRGYLARRALKALRGLVRLKTLIGRQSVKNQANTTLKCMQTLNRMQFEIRARRTRMTEENAAMQRQIQQKNEKELEKINDSTGSDWDDSIRSKEQVEANLQYKREAAIRRERALAYAYSHQHPWKNAINSSDHTFMDPNNPHWGWSWLERWMAARPWDNGNATDKDPNSGVVPVKRLSISLQDAKTHSPTSHKQSRPSSRQSPSTPNSKSARKIRPSNSSPRGTDDDSKSVSSVLSERCRRHSVAGSSVKDDESVVSSATLPSYMVPTVSARARSRLGLEEVGTPEKASGGSAKKRLSFSSSPGGPRRHSIPAHVSPAKDIAAN